MTKQQPLSRRDFLRVSAASATLMTLAACAPAAAPQAATDGETSADAPAAEAITLRISSWDGTDAEEMENLILEGFLAENPHVTVKYEFNPDAYTDKLLTAIAGGNAPDVFLWWNFPKMVDLGGIEDLTPYLDGANGLDTSIYYKEILDYNRVGDGLYGLPKDFTSRALFYNKALFDEAGVPYPTNDWTWDDLVETATQLTKGEGAEAQYGFFAYNETYPIQPYIWSNGGDFISPDGTVASGYSDSDATIQALDWYVGLQHTVAPTAENVGTFGSADQMFVNNRLALYDNGRWPQASFKDAEDLDFGTVLPPKSPNTDQLVTVLHEAGFCMSPDSEYKSGETWELLKWLASPMAHKVRTEAGWAIPAVPAVVEELGLLDDPIEKTWFEAVPFATVPPCFVRTTVWDEADSEFGVAIETAFLGDATIEESMTAATPIVDGILAGA